MAEQSTETASAARCGIFMAFRSRIELFIFGVSVTHSFSRFGLRPEVLRALADLGIGRTSRGLGSGSL